MRSKDVPILDVTSEAINNPIRLIAGWYMVTDGVFLPPLSLDISYWFVGCYFMGLKRFAEYRYMRSEGADPAEYRASFAWYDEERLLSTVVFYAAASMLFFGAFLMRYRIELVFSFPCAAWVMASYFHVAYKPDSAARRRVPAEVITP
jgi:hypothetical protein